RVSSLLTAVDNNSDLHVFWRDVINGRADIFHRVLLSDGNWTNVEPVTASVSDLSNGVVQLLENFKGESCLFFQYGVGIPSGGMRCFTAKEAGPFKEAPKRFEDTRYSFDPDGALHILSYRMS